MAVVFFFFHMHAVCGVQRNDATSRSGGNGVAPLAIDLPLFYVFFPTRIPWANIEQSMGK
jgi:hypothetical protein